MNNKGIQNWLFSTAGVVAMAAILLAVNWIAGRAKTRIDLTAERAYTLSDGTRKILAKLDTPVQVRLYASRGDENRMPVFLKNHAQAVEDLLGEFRQASKNLIEIQKLDPAPDSDAEDSAKLDGLEPRMLSMDSEPVYLGLSVTMLDQKETAPFLDPSAARLLEYEISRAITRVMTAEKPVVGVMSPLELTGGFNPMMMRGGRANPPWFIYSELKRTFTVNKIEMTTDKIPDNVKVLVLIHPRGITDEAQYAIDQFVLRGGRLIAFLDPSAALDSAGGGNPMGGGGGGPSNLEKLLAAWGLKFDSTKVVADMNYAALIQRGKNPAVLALNETAMHKDDAITTGMDNIFLAFAGAFTGTPAEGLKQDVLIKSSTNSQFVDGMTAQMAGESLNKDFTPSGTEHTLALRLSGKFKTAFPDGKPKAAPTPDENKDPAKPEEKKDAPAEAGLKASTTDGVVILVGDSDFIQDQIAVQELQNPFGGGQRMVMPRNANVAFAQGAIEQLAGDENLIRVRSRASRERPFTVVNKMQSEAQDAYRGKLKEIETSLADTQRKLNELQVAKAGDKNQRFALSPEQQAEIAAFRKKEGETKKELKDLRKSLNQAVDTLETRVKWYNIAAMPLVVIAVGIFLAIARKKKTAAA